VTDSIFNDPRSRESEQCAWHAEVAERQGKHDEAKKLYAHAAELEEEVVADVPSTSPRVMRVLAISAVALWLKAYDHERASNLATKYIAAGVLTEEDLGQMVDVQLAEMLRQDPAT
jgi:hypothetical protein